MPNFKLRHFRIFERITATGTGVSVEAIRRPYSAPGAHSYRTPASPRQRCAVAGRCKMRAVVGKHLVDLKWHSRN
jgi:hypothetical protein